MNVPAWGRWAACLLHNGLRVIDCHHHNIKDKTFFIAKGRVLMECAGTKMIMCPGQTILIQPGVEHRFTGLEDSEIFEFFTHHEGSDFYRAELSSKVELSELDLPATP